MALKEPLVKKQVGKASIMFTADDMMAQLKKKYEEHDHEVADIMHAGPDGKHNADRNETKGPVSAKTGRTKPKTNYYGGGPMPDDLAFMFQPMQEFEARWMWKCLTALFFLQCFAVIAYAWALSIYGETHWRLVTVLFCPVMWWLAVQNIFVDHDIMHGAMIPTYWWQKFITHPFSDFLSIPWDEFIAEHQKHHAATYDLLEQGEWGWDPETPLYWLAGGLYKPTEEERKNGEEGKNANPIWFLTIFLVPVVHFFGLNDTGAIFCCEWYTHFPESTGGKCGSGFWSKWFPRRVKHEAFVLWLWACVWFLGNWSTGHGWTFLLCVSMAARLGYGSAWFLITSFTHSHPWNEFLAANSSSAREWPLLHSTMGFILGGKIRWNEMLFHDVHHAYPALMGTLSRRGRFAGTKTQVAWERVHDACLSILDKELWVDNSETKTKMQKQQKRRSIIGKEAANKRSAIVGSK